MTQSQVNQPTTDTLQSIGQSMHQLIDINHGLADFHYIIGKLACQWVGDQDGIRSLLSKDDIDRLATLNEVLYACDQIAKDSSSFSPKE
jgi:hypothetical protein